jgi:glutamyl-tRNA reductase
LLDRLSAATADTTASELADEAQAHGAVFLSTCNRVEAYLDVDPGTDRFAIAATIRGLAAASGMPADQFGAKARISSGNDALHHLFSVTAGLESVVAGEDEIAGQVRRAYDAARADGITTPELDKAFQRAAKVSREVRASAGVGREGRSLVQFALKLAGHRVTDWRTTRVLVLGTGNYAATTIQALRGLGVAEIAVYSATGRARTFAQKYGLEPHHDLRTAMERAEVVITCTKAYTLTPDHVPADGARRLILDLGLPRNVDPAVGRLPETEVVDLEVIAMHAGMPELSADRTARELVRTAAGRFTAEQLSAPAVVALRHHIFDALDAEIARAEGRAPTPEAAAFTVESLRHLAGVLLHVPSERARDAAAIGGIADFEAALHIVFGLDTAAYDAHRVTPLPFSEVMRLPRDPDADAAAGEGAVTGADAGSVALDDSAATGSD